MPAPTGTASSTQVDAWVPSGATPHEPGQSPLSGLLYAPAGLTGDSNVDYIVLQVTCGIVDVVLTGDAEIASEQAMLAAGVVSPVEVMKVGHHGSRSPTSHSLMHLVRPYHLGCCMTQLGLTATFGKALEPPSGFRGVRPAIGTNHVGWLAHSWPVACAVWALILLGGSSYLREFTRS